MASFLRDWWLPLFHWDQLYNRPWHNTPQKANLSLNTLPLHGFSLIPCCRRWRSTFRTCSTCSSNALSNTTTSSKYLIAISPLNSPRQCSIYLWKFAGTFVKPKGICTHSYRPHGIIKAVYGRSVVKWTPGGRPFLCQIQKTMNCCLNYPKFLEHGGSDVS